jgi:hypothetical protein
MSACGPKQTSSCALQMSAFGGKADMGWCIANVRLPPLADIVQVGPAFVDSIFGARTLARALQHVPGHRIDADLAPGDRCSSFWPQPD